MIFTFAGVEKEVLLIAVFLVGIICGFINTLAGSGSLISLPLLMFLGLPATVANGTNRLGILMQGITGVYGFHKQRVIDTSFGFLLVIPAVAGAITGAFVASDISNETMERVIGIIMILMLIPIIFNTGKWLKKSNPSAKKNTKKIFTIFQVVFYLAIGFYGGFIQAGVGVFLLSALILISGYDPVRANALKVLIILLYTPFALGVFILNNQVDWFIGLLLGGGNIIGAYIATRLTMARWANQFIRWLLIIVIVASAGKLLFF